MSGHIGGVVTSIAEHNTRWADLPVLQSPRGPIPDDHPDNDVALLDSWISDQVTINLTRDRRRPSGQYQLSAILAGGGPVTGWFVRFNTDAEARAAVDQVRDTVKQLLAVAS